MTSLGPSNRNDRTRRARPDRRTAPPADPTTAAIVRVALTKEVKGLRFIVTVLALAWTSPTRPAVPLAVITGLLLLMAHLLDLLRP